MKASLSFSVNPTLFTLPNLASASPTLSNTFRSSSVASTSFKLPKVSVLLASSPSVSKKFDIYRSFWMAMESAAFAELYTTSAIRTRIQCVGCESRFQMNEMYCPGSGVVMSGGVYRKLMGKILVFGGVVNRLGLNGKMPRPFVVVHSGNTTITLCGCSDTSVFRSVIFAFFPGNSCGFLSARNIARNSEMYSTCLVWGYDTVKIGSKIAARYRESMGLVNELAMTFPGCGTLPSCFCAREPFFTPSICRSIHHIPGIPRIIHNTAFLNNDPSGNHCRNRK